MTFPANPHQPIDFGHHLTSAEIKELAIAVGEELARRGIPSDPGVFEDYVRQHCPPGSYGPNERARYLADLWLAQDSEQERDDLLNSAG